MRATGEKLDETARVTVDRVGVVLHDMCQPLTVLRCRLELGLLFGDPKAMREALEDSLDACLRLSGTVEQMRRLMERTKETKGNRSRSNAGRV